MTFDLEKERAADEALPYPLDANEIWVSGKGQMHINPPNAPSIFFTLSDLCEFRNLFHGQAAEIERLRAENAWLKSDREFQSEEQAARIKELEEALVEEGAKGLFNGQWDSGLSCGGYDEEMAACRREARRRLRADGKIGPDAKPRSWQITEERKAAIERLIIPVEILLVDHETDPEIEDAVRLLRGMLEGAGQ